MSLTRRSVMLGLPAALAACGAAEPIWAPEDAVRRATYRHPGPPALTLFTMRSTGNNNGYHTGLMVSASQRVLFDPAGTFQISVIPERNDVHYGITPEVERVYISYHSRETFYTERQYAVVPAEVAELALQLVQNYGAVPKAACARATSSILMQLPGFETLISSSLFPDRLSRQFGRYPGVRTDIFRENDSADKSVALAEIEAQFQAQGVGQ